MLCMSQFQASSDSGEVYSAPVIELKEEEEKFEEQPPRERSNTMPSAEPAPLEEVPGGVVLRVPTGPKQSPEKRKSGKNNKKKSFFCPLQVLQFMSQHQLLLKSLKSLLQLLVLKS